MLLNLLTILFLAPLFVDSTDPALNDDVLGLIVFKAGLKDPQSKLTSWNEDNDNPCNWVGINCDPSTNRVSEIILNGFSLSGHIGKSLIRLQFLKVLSLSVNNFTGIINPVFAQFESIQIIDFSYNNLSGSIPDELFRQCRSLRLISVANNNLSGKLPDSLSSCSPLEGINFSSNQMSGPLPYGIWSLTGLRSIDLSSNLLEGEIPRGIQSLFDLRTVNLSRNKFFGQLPDDIGDCLLLESLDFSSNFLSGSLPESMQKLSLCTSLILRGNSFTGEIPFWIGDMRGLETLDLSTNNFSGRIPNSIGNLQFLSELNLSVNRLIGNLPESLGKCFNLSTLEVNLNLLTGNLPHWIFELGLKTVSLSGNKLSGRMEYPSLTSMAASYQSIQILDFSSNALSGEIPSVIGNFSSLRLLNLSRNFLTGPIPATIGELKSAQVVDLSSNRLNGSIPNEIGGAILLQELRLDNNFLTGKITDEIENCSSLTSLVLSQNNLTGPIPVSIANLTDLQILNLSFNNLSGNLPKELTNLSHLLVFNISHNHLCGEIPVGGFFNTVPLSSVSGNPSLCGSVLNHSCPAVHPKPIVLNPNSSSSPNGKSFPPNFHRKRIELSISTLIAIGAAIFISLGVVTVTILNLYVRSSISNSPKAMAMSHEDEFSHSPITDSSHGKLVMFSGEAGFSSGAQALLNKESEIGRGGFGTVYLTLLQDGRSVAIKKLNISSLIKSQEDFELEIRDLGRIRHRNLVAIEGYYWTPSFQLLINEYICKGSLYKHLHEGKSEILSWQERFNLILGTAKGLAHLHQMKIIHYDMKSSNILIDDCGEPKVGDFGIARLLTTLDRYVLSSKVQSALGYMAPEFSCQTVKITEKCDVYGFGILILEVVTGKKPVEYMEDDVVVLCDLVRSEVEEGRAEECVDGGLRGNFPEEEAIPVIKLGLVCASQVPSNRPKMEEVVKILELIHCPTDGLEELE